MPKTDPKLQAFSESILTQLEDSKSELSTYFSTLSVKFILENLGKEKGNKFLLLLDSSQEEAFEFATNEIADFENKLSHYLQKYLIDIKDSVLI